jgi:plastocyanin
MEAKMHKLVVVVLLIGAFIGPSLAAETQIVDVDMSNFKFAPASVDLHAGVPTVLRLRNVGGRGHSFSAPEFFAAAKLGPEAAVLVRDGRVEVAGHATVDVPLIPTAGQYPLKCTHALHSAFGMKGTIIVH